MRSSLFRQVTRCRVEERFNPSENRLTEVLAAVLERAPSLAQAMALKWLGHAVDGDVDIATQVPTRGGGFVDAEIAFRNDERPPLILWAENKHGAGLHGTQIETYRNDLNRLECDADSRVIILAPSYAIPDGSPPELTHTWQDAARIVQRVANSKGLPPVQEWLLKEFHRYLREERLTDTNRFAPNMPWRSAMRRRRSRSSTG